MKFYLIEADSIEIKNHHIVIPFYKFYWLINLYKSEVNNLISNSYIFQYDKFQDWNLYAYQSELVDFFKSRHTFKVIGYYFDGSEKGFNCFDLNDTDLMYLKLME